jgi:hypothetical protein
MTIPFPIARVLDTENDAYLFVVRQSATKPDGLVFARTNVRCEAVVEEFTSMGKVRCLESFFFLHLFFTTNALIA